MADPVSLSFAIAGIPGIFRACVECFQYIRLGQRFGDDFGFCLAKLEAVQLRLTRWAEPIGLLEGKIELDSSYRDEDIIKAYKWLGQIEAAFEEAKKTSAKYADKQKAKGSQMKLELLDEDDKMGSDNSIGALVASVRTVTKERQKRLGFSRKITWALYGKDDFDSLIEDLVSLTNDLVELFPLNKPRHEELCKQEICGLEKESVLALIHVLKNEDENSSKTDDEILIRVISDHIETHRLEFGNVKIDGNGTVRLGDEYGYQSGVKPGNVKVGTIDAKGDAYIHSGHVFYGPRGAQGMHSYGKSNEPSQSHIE